MSYSQNITRETVSRGRRQIISTLNRLFFVYVSDNCTGSLTFKERRGKGDGME